MGVYTKNGDNGLTNLIDTKNISKSDDRIELIGTLEELTSNIGLVKTMEESKVICEVLYEIQETLLIITRWIAKPFDKEYKLKPELTKRLEEEIEKLEETYLIQKSDIIPGKNKKAAQADIVRAIVRRAERRLIETDKKYGGDKNVKSYINRLSDYFFVLARFYELEKKDIENEVRMQSVQVEQVRDSILEESILQGVYGHAVQEIKITLAFAKRLIEEVEQFSKEKGICAVIAICGADGNMIAVHKMDGAFLASFDVAMKKAYTAVAVKMTTFELGKLAVPGGTFYGVDKADNGKIIIFGGGAPLFYQGNVIGGIGVSGGTGEQDHEISRYAQQVFQEFLANQ